MLIDDLRALYPDVSPHILDSAVNIAIKNCYSLMDNSSVDEFLYTIGTYTDDELLSFRHMGIKKVRFLRKIQAEHPVSARNKMRFFQERYPKKTDREMADLCGISEVLLKMVKNGHVTHPIFAENIRKAYNLTELEAEELMPENRRPHSPKYNPNKYVIEPVDLRDIRIVKPSSKDTEYERYVHSLDLTTRMMTHGVH